MGPRDYVLVTRALSLEGSLDQCPDTYALHHTNTPAREMTIAHSRGLKTTRPQCPTCAAEPTAEPRQHTPH